jgi:RNA polymerase sigma-70 factor (ECF subfamily)
VTNTPLTRVSEADGDRLAALMREFEPGVRRYFGRRIRDAAAVEDLTQEVFLRLLRRSSLQEIDNATGYIFQVAANLLNEHLRSGMRRIPAASGRSSKEVAEPSEERSPERIFLAREEQERMVVALRELSERTRTILILNRFEELSGTEIAQRLGVSVSLVEKEMMRAIAHLRKSVL